MELALLLVAVFASDCSAVYMGAMQAGAGYRLPDLQPTAIHNGDFARRQDIPEVTANPDDPTLQGYVSGDPNNVARCSQGSTAFLQTSGGFACCSGNCGSYTAPTACETGGTSSQHTFGLTTSCADSVSTECNAYIYNYPDATYTFAFCNVANDSPNTVTVLATTTDATTTSSSQPTTTSSTTSSEPQTTTSSTPETTSSSQQTFTSSDNPTTSSSSSFPNSIIVGPTPSTTSSDTTSSSGIAAGDNNGGSGNDSSNNNSGGSGGGSNTGAIAGGVVGGVVGLALIGALVWFLLSRRRKRAAITPTPYDPYNPPAGQKLNSDYYPRAYSPPPTNTGPYTDAPVIPAVASGAPLGNGIQEKFGGSSIGTHSPDMSTLSTAGAGGGKLAVVNPSSTSPTAGVGELQGSEIHELPAMSAKALPSTSPDYHELDNTERKP